MLPQTYRMSIRIFVTGGTFDKEYNEITGQLFFKETHLPGDDQPEPGYPKGYCANPDDD